MPCRPGPARPAPPRPVAALRAREPFGRRPPNRVRLAPHFCDLPGRHMPEGQDRAVPTRCEVKPKIPAWLDCLGCLDARRRRQLSGNPTPLVEGRCRPEAVRRAQRLIAPELPAAGCWCGVTAWCNIHGAVAAGRPCHALHCSVMRQVCHSSSATWLPKNRYDPFAASQTQCTVMGD